MNNATKNILLVVILLVLCVGVGYLGMKIIGMDNKTAPTATAPAAGETKQNNEESQDIQAKIEAAEGCQSSDECIIVSISNPAKGKKDTTVQCLNKTLLETCSNCDSSKELDEEIKQEATCGCVENLCQFDVFAAR